MLFIHYPTFIDIFDLIDLHKKESLKVFIIQLTVPLKKLS